MYDKSSQSRLQKQGTITIFEREIILKCYSASGGDIHLNSRSFFFQQPFPLQAESQRCSFLSPALCDKILYYKRQQIIFSSLTYTYSATEFVTFGN